MTTQCREMTINESLEKVEHDLGFASDGLRDALHKASAVEALILIPLIKQINDARNEVAALFDARKSAPRTGRGFPALPITG